MIVQRRGEKKERGSPRPRCDKETSEGKKEGIKFNEKGGLAEY